jgi:chemotaxis protein methyltransferase CheR
MNELDSVLRWIGERTGLTFSAHRLPAVETTLRRSMAQRRSPDAAAFHRELERDPEAFDDLVSELTIGETYFFRETPHFDFVEREVIPDVRARRGRDHVIRCWSAGCSSGEEAYSLAILFGDHGLLDHAHLVGTDVSRAALARALCASYRQWSFRGDAASRALRHFTRHGDRYVLRDEVRTRVSFEYLNLALDTYPAFGNGIWGMDLVFCRNVLIYFDRATIRSVAQRLYAALAEGGWLVTASSDPPLGDEAPFEVASTDHGIFYRRASVPNRPDVPRAWSRREPNVSLPPSDVVERRRDDSPFPTLPRSAAKTATPTRDDVLARARDAFAHGDYPAVVALLADRTSEAAAAALHLRALANVNPEQAVEAAAAAARRHELSSELHYLQAAMFLELDRLREAAEAMRRVIYLDRSLTIAHFSLGTILQRMDDLAGASRSFRNARDLCAALPPETPLPLSDGELAGRVAEAAEAHLAVIERAARATTGRRGAKDRL